MKMKKFKTMLAMMLALFCVGFAFTSCGDDDSDNSGNGGNNTVNTDIAKVIAGTYHNKLSMTVMGEASVYKNAAVVVEKVDETTLKITLPACGEGMMALPALEVPAVKIAGSGGIYTLAQENYTGSVTVNGAEKKYTVTLNGTFKENGKVLVLNYSLQYGKMPAAMIGKFDSSAVLTAAEAVAGAYVSNLEMTVMGESSTYENATVNIEAVDDNTVKITLPACGEGMMALPALEIPAVKVEGADGDYSFAVENYKGTVTVNGAEKNYTVTLSGTYKDNRLTLNYSLQYGKMPAAMIGKFVTK